MSGTVNTGEDCEPGAPLRGGVISIVVPCYNQERYVQACIESALAQRGVEIEIIAVNDGSTDASSARLRAFGGAIDYVEQANAGLSNARNVGLRRARGEFVQFLDSDDILGPDVLARQVDALEHSGADITLCRNRLFHDTDRTGRPKSVGEWRLPATRFDVHLCHFNIAPPHAYLWRRSYVDRVGSFDETLRACEDYDFTLRAVMAGARFTRMDGAHVFYRRHPASMSANKSNQYRHDVIMHRRLHGWLLDEARYPQTDLCLKLTAHVAGLLASTSRAAALDDGNVAILCALLDAAVRRLIVLTPDRTSLAFFYACLGLRHLREARRVAAHVAPESLWNDVDCALRARRGPWWQPALHGGDLSVFERMRWCALWARS